MISKGTDDQESVSYQALLDENHSLQRELNSLKNRLKEDERLRHAEEELRKSEERYRTLFMNMTEGFLLAEIIYNKEGKPYDYRYLEVNPAFELHTGMKREQILGRTVLEVFPRVNHKLVEKYLEIAFTDKSKYFEVFSQEFHKHLDIYVFSPGKGKIAIIFKDITERKQMEEKTRQRVEELEAVMEVVPVAISIAHDTQSRNITGNRMANEIYGAKTGENVSANITPVRHFFQKGHELAADELPMQKATLKDIDVRNEELDMLLPSGEWVTILGSASPLHDINGNVRGGVAAFMDITERKKAEAKLKETLDNLEELIKQRTEELEKAYNSLKESEEHLRLALECAKAGMWMLDFQDNWKTTPQMNALFGRSESSPIKYEEFISMIHPEDQERVAQAWNKATECKEFYDQEYRIIWQDDSIHWLSSKGSVIELHSGIRQFMGITTDITERKQAEEKIRHLANIVESSNDAIITKSLNGTITSWNKGAEQIYGYSAEEILGKEILILEPEDLKGEIKQLSDKVKQDQKILHYETLRLKKDGTKINVSLSLSPVFDSTGKLTAISVIVRDITERKKAEEALAKMEATRNKEIHHRIKNNLQVISSLLDLAAEKFNNRQLIENKEVLEAFRESQNRVMSIAFIHKELHEGEGLEKLNFSLYLEKLAENLFQTYRVGHSGIGLDLNLEDNVFFDTDIAVPLGMIVNELIFNSFKYAFPDRNKGTIRIKLFGEGVTNEPNSKEELIRKDTKYTLIVSDNGIGIPENIDLESTDTLGLQLVSILVDQLDGEIKVRRDQGTEFTIWFNEIGK